MLVASDDAQLAALGGQGDDADGAQAAGVVLVAFALGGMDELDEAASLVAPLRLFDGAAAGVGDALALDAALRAVVVAGMVAAGIAHGDEAVEGVVLVPHGAAVRAASPHDAAEIVAELANGGRGWRVLGAGRSFSACGVDEAVGVDGVLQAPARVVVPVAPAAGVVADRSELSLRVVTQGFGLLEARAAPAAFERSSFGVVAEGVEHAEGTGVPAQASMLVPFLKPVRGGRSGVARFDRPPECVVFEVL